MSAYICSDRQFQTIAEYAAEYMGASAATLLNMIKLHADRASQLASEKTKSAIWSI